MAALDFPSNPTVGQQYAAPNGVTYQWDGAVWVVTGGPPGQLWTGAGSTLTPTDTTKTVAGVAPNALQLGSRTIKARVVTPSGAGTNINHVTANLALNAAQTAWLQDDATRSSWDLNIATDTGGNDWLHVDRYAPGGSSVNLLALDNAGKLIIPGSSDTTDQSALLLGQRTQKGRLTALPALDFVALTKNRRFTGSAWARDDTAQPSWTLALNENDQCVIVRENAAGVAANPLTLDNGGNLTIIGATATKASGTTWANPSDRRLKDEIVDYVTGLSAILELAPRTFVYNGKAGSEPGRRGYSFIADEVAAVMPEMVGVTKAKLNPDDTEETDIQTLDTSNLVLALVNAVKELATRLATLETHA